MLEKAFEIVNDNDSMEMCIEIYDKSEEESIIEEYSLKYFEIVMNEVRGITFDMDKMKEIYQQFNDGYQSYLKTFLTTLIRFESLPDEYGIKFKLFNLNILYKEKIETHLQEDLKSIDFSNKSKTLTVSQQIYKSSCIILSAKRTFKKYSILHMNNQEISEYKTRIAPEIINDNDNNEQLALNDILFPQNEIEVELSNKCLKCLLYKVRDSLSTFNQLFLSKSLLRFLSSKRSTQLDYICSQTNLSRAELISMYKKLYMLNLIIIRKYSFQLRTTRFYMIFRKIIHLYNKLESDEIKKYLCKICQEAFYWDDFESFLSVMLNNI